MENTRANIQIRLCNDTQYQVGACFHQLTKSDPKERLYVTIGFDYVQRELIMDKDREFKSTYNPSKTFRLYKSIPLEHSSTCPCYQMNMNSELYSFMPSQLYPKMACCVLVLDSKNRLLLTRRNKNSYTFPSCWVVPGGHVDKGESFEQCALREVEEETGIKIEKKLKANNDFDYYYLGTECEYRPFMAYESVYPTLLELGLPKAQHLIMFYYLRIDLEHCKIKVKIQEEEVDKAIWIQLNTLKNILEGKYEKNEEFSCFSIGSNGYPVTDSILREHLEGVYPNNAREGLGEGHLRAVKYFANSEYNVIGNVF
jgi:8-oxo-dGTP pyrophosphatase MutT (NUDIX family)